MSAGSRSQPELALRGRGILTVAHGTFGAGLDAVASGILGLIERGVGRLQQFFRVRSGVPGSNPQAETHIHAGASRDDAAICDTAADAFSQFPCFGGAAAENHDPQLFPAVAAPA